MDNGNEGQNTGASGAPGVLRVIAVIGVVLLAGLTTLLVLDLIPRDVFRQTLIQAVLTIGIIGTAGAVISLLVKPRP